MNWRRPRPILLLAVLIGSGILLWVGTYDSKEESLPQLGARSANNSFSHVRYQMRDMQGEIIYQILAERLDQFAQSQQIQLAKPRVEGLSQGHEDSWSEAERGVIDKRQLQLIGDVSIMLHSSRQSPLLIHSSSLRLEPDQKRIRTSQDVTISSAQTSMRGTGLEYRLDEQTGVLHGNVTTLHFSTGLREPTYPLLKQVAEATFASAHAAEHNSEYLEINADRMEWDIDKKVYVYSGNVRATRDTLVLAADRVVVLSGDGKVKTLRAEGDARWTQQLDSGEPMLATAEQISYEIANRIVVLRRNVQLQSGEVEFAGDHVIWLLDENRIATSAGEKSPKKKQRQRVRIRLNAN